MLGNMWEHLAWSLRRPHPIEECLASKPLFRSWLQLPGDVDTGQAALRAPRIGFLPPTGETRPASQESQAWPEGHSEHPWSKLVDGSLSLPSINKMGTSTFLQYSKLKTRILFYPKFHFHEFILRTHNNGSIASNRKEKNWPQSGKNREMVKLPPVFQTTELHVAAHNYVPTH